MKFAVVLACLIVSIYAQFGAEYFSYNTDCSSVWKVNYLNGCNLMNTTGKVTSQHWRCSASDPNVFIKRTCTTTDCKEYGFDCQNNIQASMCRAVGGGMYSQTGCKGQKLVGAVVQTFSGNTCGDTFTDYPTVYLTGSCIATGSKSFRYACTADTLTRTDFDGTSCSVGNVDSIVATSTCGRVGGKQVRLISCGDVQVGGSMTFSVSFVAVILGFAAMML